MPQGLRSAVRAGVAGMLVAALLSGASCSTPPQRAGVQSLAFDVHWPLIDPSDETPPKTRPLLKGRLTIRPDELGTPRARMVIGLVLTRPHEEEDRTRWNGALAYREYDWMRHVRVWDEDRKWLYPNLAYLFKLHGVDREERYGGWDPGKDVDNDFGAVLVRKYDAAGGEEHPDTKGRPLVSAAWHEVGAADAGKLTVCHTVKSDDFTIHLTGGKPPHRGGLKVWFVYGDFMGHRVPKGWPDAPEFDGGAVAFFRVDWHYAPGQPFSPVAVQEVPPGNTNFDWKRWIARPEEAAKPGAKARLSERDGASGGQGR
jgi:hypothetical protein